MTIHTEHPFAAPEPERDPARRLRGRLAAPVTLWASGTGAERVGLTVSSMLVVPGEPAALLGLVDPDSDLGERLRAGVRVAVSVLGPAQRRLADAFGGFDPAPGGPFAAASFTDTGWGPRPTASDTWAGAVVVGVRPVGWSHLVEARLEHVALGEEPGLVHLRGRLVELG